MRIELRNTVTAAALVAVTAIGAMPAHADGRDDDDATPIQAAPRAGCYAVVRGHMEESTVDAGTVIGEYRFVLAPSHLPHGPRLVLAGPVSGREDGHEEEAPGDAEPDGPHGGHHFGTHRRVGTFSSTGDSIHVTSASCPSGDGTPRSIKGIETIRFGKGTGVFTNLDSGQIEFDLTFDACNNRNNPVADLKVIRGQLCFR